MDFEAELSKFEPGSKEYKFFQKVFEKLGPNFVRKSIEERKREARSRLNTATEKYFQFHILVDAIIRSAEQFEKSEDVSFGLSTSNEVSSSVHPLYFNLLKNYLPPEESQKLKLFGLSQEKIIKTSENKKSESERAAFKKLVEDNINDFCKKLILCAESTVLPGENWKNAFDRTMKELESKVNLVSSKEIKGQSQKQLREMIKTYYEELSKGVSLLSKALSLHEQKLEFESDLGEFYLQRCHAVFLKIKCFELKVLQATYNKETMPALKKIRAQLDQSEAKLKEEHNEKTAALESYMKLGKEYENVVDEYTRLSNNIKEQQWAIDELKGLKLQYGASNCD